MLPLLKNKTLLGMLLFTQIIPWTFAQSIPVMPVGVGEIPAGQVGNLVGSVVCSNPPTTADATKTLAIDVLPSCYGQNLRGGGSVLDPKGGPVVMNLTLTNNAATPKTVSMKVTIPVKTTYPSNYGQTCTLAAGNALSCDQNDLSGAPKKVSYSCTAVATGWFLNDYLNCERVGDPLAHGDVNKSIKCSYFFNWAGTGYAAVNSYTKVSGVANCGISSGPGENWNSAVAVTSSSTFAVQDKSAVRGSTHVQLGQLSYPRQTVLQDNTTNTWIVKGSPTVAAAHFSQDGRALTTKIETSWNKYETCLTVKPSFLGQNRFCGSFYSPLMLFFDGKTPQFVGRSAFPLVENVKMMNWPEAKSSGFWLARDVYKNKKILNANQLFREHADIKNGFDDLKLLDKNNDNVIDEKDPIFSELVLWNDKNGNGVSESGEVFTLKEKGVTKINLAYNHSPFKPFGNRAEMRESSKFEFTAKGKVVQGDIVDVWLAPLDASSK